jgi:5-methylcytosine-specific restriction enzyme A
MKITTEQIEAAYDVAKLAFANEMSLERGADMLHVDHGLNRNSAKHFIEDYRLLRQGDVYTRTLSVPAADIFLDRIFADDGPEALAAAIAAIRKHIVYYEKQRDITLQSLPETVDRHEQRPRQPKTLEVVQERPAHAVKKALAQFCRRSRLNDSTR